MRLAVEGETQNSVPRCCKSKPRRSLTTVKRKASQDVTAITLELSI